MRNRSEGHYQPQHGKSLSFIFLKDYKGLLKIILGMQRSEINEISKQIVIVFSLETQEK